MVVLAVIIPLVMLGVLMALDRYEDLVFPAAPAADPADGAAVASAAAVPSGPTAAAEGTGGPLGTGTRVR
ncbi:MULTISPECIES: hypothetical protein [unclassified Streptomyces]|uniref:hypothetical protein n=1 Tax=unclassified Streptomyces TaxID=2593676 RepID=UPI0004C0E7E9|nr:MULTISPECIES: hypothetical protein [unclassified Streptomyces]